MADSRDAGGARQRHRRPPPGDPAGGRFLYRLQFRKSGPARFYSHHDLMRLFERALRRADLPVSLSEGFNQRPRITFLSALSLGVESLDERVEIELTEPRPAEQLRDELGSQVTEGLVIVGAEAVAARAAAVAAEYEARLPAGATPDPAPLLALPSVPVERRSAEGVRTVDIRPWIAAITVEDGVLRFTIRITDSGAARPEEILKLLGVGGTPLVRTRTVLADKGGARA